MPGQSQQFYHSCGTQGTNSRDIHVMDVACELDAIARRIQRFQACAGQRIRCNARPFVGDESLTDCARQGGRTLQTRRYLDTIALALRRSSAVEAIGGELVSPILNIGARSVGEAGVFQPNAAGQQVCLGGPAQQEARERVSRSKDALMEPIQTARTRDRKSCDDAERDNGEYDSDKQPRGQRDHASSSPSSPRPRIRSRARRVPDSAGLPMAIASL